MEWSQCSTTCGRGTRERIKKCVEGEEDGYICDKVKDKTHEVEKCEDWPPFEKEKCPSEQKKKNTSWIFKKIILIESSILKDAVF